MAVATVDPQTGKLNLKYLFGAQYVDGNEYFQTPEDVPVDPNAPPGKSAFYDLNVLDEDGEQPIDPFDGRTRVHGDIRYFQLKQVVAEDEVPNIFIVDLTNGLFQANGAVFSPVNAPPIDPKTGLSVYPLELLFDRAREHDMESTYVVGEDNLPTGPIKVGKELEQRCWFNMGYKYYPEPDKPPVVVTITFD